MSTSKLFACQHLNCLYTESDQLSCTLFPAFISSALSLTSLSFSMEIPSKCTTTHFHLLPVWFLAGSRVPDYSVAELACCLSHNIWENTWSIRSTDNTNYSLLQSEEKQFHVLHVSRGKTCQIFFLILFWENMSGIFIVVRNYNCKKQFPSVTPPEG